MAAAPRAFSRARSSATWDGSISGQEGLIRRRSYTGTPRSIRADASSTSESMDRTTPFPIRHCTPSRRMPEGMRCSTVFSAPITSVWPALWSPWKRATAATRSVSRSTILPLPSSPHWVPMTTTFLPMMFVVPGCEACSVAYEVQQHKSGDHADQPYATDAAVVEFGDGNQGFAPAARAGERQQPLEHEIQGECRPEITPLHAASPFGHSPAVARGTGGRSALGAAGVVQVTEEITVGIQHQQVAGQPYRVPIGLDAAVESVELPVPVEGAGIDLRGDRVALTADLLRLPVRLGDENGALAVGIGAHAFSLLGAFRAQLRRHGRALLAHAPVHRLRHILGELDPFHAHVDQFDAELGCRLRRGDHYVVHEHGTLQGHHLAHRSLGELVSQIGLENLQQPTRGDHLVAARGYVVLPRIPDAPLQEEVHEHGFLLRGNHFLGWLVQRQDLARELPDVVDDRHFEMQTGLVVGSDDLAESELEGILALVDGEDRKAEDHQCQTEDDDDDETGVTHQRVLLARASSRFLGSLCSRICGSELAVGSASEPSPPAPRAWRCISLSIGRYSRLPLPSASRRILLERCRTSSMDSM